MQKMWSSSTVKDTGGLYLEHTFCRDHPLDFPLDLLSAVNVKQMLTSFIYGLWPKYAGAFGRCFVE